ncbi:hypothetical protein [Stenotrophomonas sp.]|uniref:hypothetical protein n=1 Tax=Stenotrophomonas sp. TaxID=69392 RepID=UPI0028A99F0A|nr:hypothetical protein [Stenotrophomonas sp.]
MSKIGSEDVIAAASKPNFWQSLLGGVSRSALLEPDTAGCIATLHEEGQIDLLMRFPDAMELDGHEFFLAFHLISRILPLIEADENIVMDAVLALHAKASPDLASASILDSFGRWASNRPDKLASMLRNARCGQQSAVELLPQLINASDDDSLALELLQAQDTRVINGALLALTWKVPPEERRNEYAEALLKLASFREERGVSSRLLPAAVSVLSQSHEARLSDLLDHYGSGGSLQDLHSACEGLCRYSLLQKDSLVPQFVNLIEAMLEVYPTEHAVMLSALSNLTYDRVVLISGSSLRRLADKAMPVGLSKVFIAAMSRVLGNRNFAPNVMGDWLAYGGTSLLATLHQVIGIEENPAEALAVDLSQVPPDRWPRAMFAATGWLFTNQYVAVNSILWVLRNSHDSEQIALAKMLLIDVFVKNYGGVLQMLESLEHTDTLTVDIHQELLMERRRLENMRSIDVPELHPSEQMQSIRQEIEARSHQAAGDAIEPEGLLAFIPVTSILYGSSVLSAVHSSSRDAEYREVSMQTLSIQYEEPRMLAQDPLLLDMILLKCREKAAL